MTEHVAPIARSRSRRARACQARAGFSLAEVAAAGLVLTIGVCGLSSSILSSMAMNRTNEETAIAQRAARSAIERLEGESFAQVFARHDSNPANDPAGPNTAPGASFAVTGLTAAPDDADGRVGEYIFPTQVIGGVEQLREDVTDARLGMPADLDGSGAVDSSDHATNYRLLPVRVRLRWKGANGIRTFTVESILCNRS